MFLDILHQSLLFLPFLLGPFLSYAISGIADLSIEGSYVLSIVVFASLLSKGLCPEISALTAILSAGGIGIFVGLLQTKGKISPLLAGVLTLFLLQSANLILLGKPHLSLLHLLSGDKERDIMILSGIDFFLVAFTYLLLRSRFGLYFHSLKKHRIQLRKLSLSPTKLTILILTLSNIIVGLAGIMAVYSYGYASTQMAQGQAIVAIGLVVMAHELSQLLRKSKVRPPVPLQLFALFFVNTLYFTLISILFMYGIDPLYLKLCVGGAFVLMLILKGRIQNEQSS